MIPMGWMTPLCIACGNTMVIKAASMTPMTSMRCDRTVARSGIARGRLERRHVQPQRGRGFLTHPDVRGITFVGSTSVGLHVYATAAAHGKRVQALCEAKNHGLVLEDAALERTARGIINSRSAAPASGAWRCR